MTEAASGNPIRAEAEDGPYLWKRRYAELYRAELSGLYHRKRERFFALLDRGGKALSLIAGTAAFSSLLASADDKALAGLGVAISTLPGLVFAWSDKARQHGELAQKFIQVQAEIVGAGERSFTEEQVDAWSANLRRLEASEPPTLTGLVRLCQNQLAFAAGDYDSVHPLGWKRYFVHFWDMTLDSPPVASKKVWPSVRFVLLQLVVAVIIVVLCKKYGF
jgi:hypothetical protein